MLRILPTIHSHYAKDTPTIQTHIYIMLRILPTIQTYIYIMLRILPTIQTHIYIMLRRLPTIHSHYAKVIPTI